VAPVVLSTLLATVISLGGVALADHQFGDVPDSQAHHDSIGAVRGAGCATGFSDGTYRPGQNITRGQAAGFLTRCGTRAVHSEISQSGPPDDQETTLATVTLTAGATGAGSGGIVLVLGDVSFTGAESSCRCFLHMEFLDITDGIESGDHPVTIPNVTSDTVAAGGASGVTSFPIDGDETKTFGLRLFLSTTGPDQGAISGNLSAVYIPFDGDPTA
jgi:hypothetical protein